MNESDAIDARIDTLCQEYESLIENERKLKNNPEHKVKIETAVRMYGLLTSLLEFYKLKDEITPDSEKMKYAHIVEQLEAGEEQIRIRLVTLGQIARKATERIEGLGGMV